MDATEVEDEYLTEAARRMSYCDKCGTSVRARVHIIVGNGELKLCGHCVTEGRARLLALHAFIYDID